MTSDLSFKLACERIKRDADGDSKLISHVDHLLNITYIFAPFAVGPTAAALLPALATKNALVALGKNIFERLGAAKRRDYIARTERIENAYAILVYTAFFEAVDREMPASLRAHLELLINEKWHLAAAAGKEIKLPALGTEEISLTHPLDTMVQQEERHMNLWGSMAGYYRDFVMQLACWDNLKEWEKKAFYDVIAHLPAAARNQFHSQYLELCRQFPEFSLWANLRERRQLAEQMDRTNEFLQEYLSLVGSSGQALDIGFQKLQTTIAALPLHRGNIEASAIAIALRREYAARIADPIIDDRDASDGESRICLKFPSIKEAFIPQSFQVTLYRTNRELENPEAWRGFQREDNLGAFLVSFLSSPHSCLTPLLILGHPGSGKSVLTKVLSAQLSSKSYTVIRVPLREVTAEAPILTQIEEALSKVTDMNNETWRRLSPEFADYPPLVILDGYDELLQASGKVFADYLNDVRRFQEHQKEQERPVRIIVTSRVTLINKARIPHGTTIIRLLGFSAQQQALWIKCWNEKNQHYFAATTTREFSLPHADGKNAAQILPLAEQPLLLLMLAIYDANQNALHQGTEIDQARLYDRLLRQFVHRERAKDPAFIQATTADQVCEIDMEMRRLGTAALGMFNRRKVHILSSELEDDLKFFRMQRRLEKERGVLTLSQAEVLFGSFFFIHRSSVQSTGATTATRVTTSAFEFLHNTFGEFLTADFILHEMGRDVGRAISAAVGSHAQRNDYEDRMATRDGLNPTTIATLIYTPLCTRPVIVEMLRVWALHFLDGSDQKIEIYRRELAQLAKHQLRQLLSRREMPSLLNDELSAMGHSDSVPSLPLLGHMALYSLNLVTLCAVVDPEGFVFRFSDYAAHEDGTSPWNRLVHLWRSWLSLDNLDSFAAVVTTVRSDDRIVLRANSVLRTTRGGNRLTTIASVATALSDQQSEVLAGLLLFDPKVGQLADLDVLAKMAKAHSIEVQLTIATLRLQVLQRFVIPQLEDYVNTFGWLLTQQSPSAISIAVASIEPVLAQVGGDAFARFLHMETGFTPKVVHQIAGIDARMALLMVRATKGRAPRMWYSALTARIAEDTSSSDSWYLRNPADWATWFALLAELETSGEENAGQMSRLLLNAVLTPPPNDSGFNHHTIWQTVRSLLDKADSKTRADLGKKIVELANRADYFESIARVDFDATLPLILLGWEAGGLVFLRRLPSEIQHRWIATNRFLRLSQASPAAGLDFLQLVPDLAQLARAWDTEGLFDRAYQAGFLLTLSSVDPSLSAKWLEATLQNGGAEFLRRGDQFFHSLDAKLIRRHFVRNAGSVTTLLVLAQHLKRRPVLDELARCFEPGITEDELSNMPQFTLRYFKWLAAQTTNQALAAIRTQQENELTDNW